jgi:hypothetical protein
LEQLYILVVQAPTAHKTAVVAAELQVRAVVVVPVD